MLDSLDQEIINLLVVDAKQNSSILAKKLNISSSTVRRRIQKLIKLGMLHIVARVEPNMIGVPIRVILAFNVAREKVM